MWKIYLKSNEGIAIQSTFNKFKDSLNDINKPVYLGTVNYIDYEKDFFNWGNRMIPFFHKRMSFQYQHELSAIISDGDFDLSEGGVKIPISFNMIENIYLSPNSDKWFYNLIKDFVKDLKINVINSKLDDKPIY